MPYDIKAPHINTKLTPRKIISEDFQSVGDIPIMGGWGYSLDDAVIIDKNDPTVEKDMPFDGVDLEYVFVEKRIYEELIISRANGDTCAGIKWNLLKQQTQLHNGKKYDVLEFEVTGFPEKHWLELKNEWNGSNGYGSPEFDAEAHAHKADTLRFRYVTQYYFDITSFVDLA